jgi:hypothetical protein
MHPPPTSTGHIDHSSEIVESPITSCKLCASLDDIQQGGKWNKDMLQWEPQDCCFNAISPHSSNSNSTQTLSIWDQCIADKTFGFYGDSTLKNILIQLLTLGNKGTQPFNIENWAQGPSYHAGRGTLFGSNNTKKGELNMWWTPSAYFQKPSSLPSIRHDDISIISISVWDFGELFRGVQKWHSSMRSIIHDAAMSRKNKPLYIMHIHKLWPSRCLLVHDTGEGRKSHRKCQECNSHSANMAFREALESAVKCVQDEGYDNVHLIDTFGITNTSFAEERSDGVHYDDVVTSMEGQLLLQSVCDNGKHMSKNDKQQSKLNTNAQCKNDDYFGGYKGSALCGK